MNIAIIGCGNMGSGIALRLSQEHSLKLYDHDEMRTHEVAKQVKGKACKSIVDVVENVDIVILAIKPKDLKKAAAELHKKIRSPQILISILAGTSLSHLKQAFDDVILLRMMPNLAVVHGKGIVALADSEDLTLDQKKELSVIFDRLGKVHWYPEEMFDALTSLTASGPGLAFVMFEAMVDAAIAMGFTAAQGRELVLQMLDGTLSILKETGKHPGELKWQVASPGGTTIAGLTMLENSSIRSGIINAFLASFQQAKRLHE